MACSVYFLIQSERNYNKLVLPRLFNSQLAMFCQQDSFGPILETLDSDLDFSAHDICLSVRVATVCNPPVLK